MTGAAHAPNAGPHLDAPPATRQPAPVLLDDEALARRDVVANAEMNRGRDLHGVNSYTRELGLDPIELLAAAPTPGNRTWVDACCGSGLALYAARAAWDAAPRHAGLRLVGVDLVDAFAPDPPTGVTLAVSALSDWASPAPADLVTCVHGLHYVGDKLAAIARLASWLAPGGRLVASLDLAQVRRPNGRPVGRSLAADLRTAGFAYDAGRRLISCVGPRPFRTKLRYFGADAAAGPNYTGQPAVDSYYG